MKSEEPLLVNIIESMGVEASMKFHVKQFRKGFESLLEKQHKEYVEDIIMKKKEAAKKAVDEAKAKAEEEKEAARKLKEEKTAAK